MVLSKVDEAFEIFCKEQQENEAILDLSSDKILHTVYDHTTPSNHLV